MHTADGRTLKEKSLSNLKVQPDLQFILVSTHSICKKDSNKQTKKEKRKKEKKVIFLSYTKNTHPNHFDNKQHADDDANNHSNMLRSTHLQQLQIRLLHVGGGQLRQHFAHDPHVARHHLQLPAQLGVLLLVQGDWLAGDDRHLAARHWHWATGHGTDGHGAPCHRSPLGSHHPCRRLLGLGRERGRLTKRERERKKKNLLLTWQTMKGLLGKRMRQWWCQWWSET